MSKRWTIENLVGQAIDCDCGETHHIATKQVIIESNAYDKLPSVIFKLGLKEPILLASDINTFKAAGRKIKDMLENRYYQTHCIVLGEIGSKKTLSADEENVKALYQRICKTKSRTAVAVGSGTINDIVKAAAHKAKIPYIVCATAASMNGYPSSIVALMSGGVKTTSPAAPPIAVIADTKVLASAPMEMIQAGLGDLISKPVSTSDWRLASLVKGEYFCELPSLIVEEALNKAVEHAPKLKTRDKQACKALMEALVLSGFSMVIAGSSSPASGGEHLLSHYWDMTAHINNRKQNLHGAQVGVATIISATFYEKISQLQAKHINIDKLLKNYPTRKQEEQRIKLQHGSLAEEVLKHYRKKYIGKNAKKAELEWIKQNWKTILRIIKAAPSPSFFRNILKKAGAPTQPHQLGLSPNEVKKAILLGKDIRARYTVLDLAHDLGLLKNFACKAAKKQQGKDGAI